MMGNVNSQWGLAKRNQQRGNPERSQQPRQQQQVQQRKPEQARDDFGHEWLNKVVETEQVKGASVIVVRGRVIDVSKYWLKILVDGQILYVNKAYVLSIKPVEIGGGGLGEGYAGRKQ
jgi:hypothetical protein